MLVPNPDSIQGSQILQGLVEAQMEDPQAMKYTWKVDNFTRLNKNLYSEVFIVGTYRWRLLMYPKGNNVDHFSIYLTVADSMTLPRGWSRFADFSLAVVNQIYNKDTIRKDTQHRFNARDSNWGFTSFMPLDGLYDPTRGYLVNDTVFIEAEISVHNQHYTIVKVARDEDLTEQIGRDIYFDLVDHGKVSSFRIQKQTPFSLVKEEVAKEFGIPVQFLRFWLWAKRQNRTYRPNRPLTPEEELQSVGQLKKVSNKVHNSGKLNLFLEVNFEQDLCPILPPQIAKEDILVFFKLYKPEKQELCYVGRLFVNSNSAPIEILGKLNQLAGFAPEEEIEIYEEIKFEPYIMCENIDKWTSFRLSQIEDGDIICFQKSARLEHEVRYKYPDVPSFLEYAYNTQVGLQKEQQEGMVRDKAAHLYTVIKVAQDKDLAEQIGRNIHFDLVDHGRICSFRIHNHTPFRLFKEEVAAEFGIPVQFQRFWIWAMRQNRTYRPTRPLTPEEELQSDLRPVPPPEILKEDILVFFKLYEPEIQKLSFVGRLFVKSSSKPIDILAKLNELAGFALEEEIELYEEIKFEPIMYEHVDKWTTFRLSQIQDGDIICFQKSRLEHQECKYPDIPSFVEYLGNCKDCGQPDLIPISTPLIPASIETCQHEAQAGDAEAQILPAAKAAQVTVDSRASDSSLETASRAIGTQKDDLDSPDPRKDDQTLRRLSAAEELWKSTSDSAQSPEALAAFKTVTRYAGSCLANLCTDGAYEEFTAAWKVLAEQGIIPMRITFMLKELLESLEVEIPKYTAAEKLLAKGGEEIAAQLEEIKSQMELAMQKCQERKDSLANHDAKVAELEAELARAKEKRAETMADLKAAVDEMEPLKQRFVDCSSTSEGFTIKQAMLTVQKGAALGTWVVLQDVLKNCLKL